MTNFKFPLGVKCRDLITGLEGVIISRMEHINGCHRYLVQPPMVKSKGDVIDAMWCDEKSVKIISNKSVLEPYVPAGPAAG